MSSRVTQNQLKGIVALINKRTNSPTETYTLDETGHFTANIGNYHLSGAYGGWALHRIVNEDGGTTDVSGMGFATKRDLETFLGGFLEGLES